MPFFTAAQLKDACHQAFLKYPNYCNQSVWYVMCQATRPPLSLPPLRLANPLIAFLDSSPLWTAVPMSTASDYANEGSLVVGGAAETGNGHVIVVYPGMWKARGGYSYVSPKDGKQLYEASNGSYPRAMSTSVSSWPGTRSDGDKTVWDPWGNDTLFRNVKFWVQKNDIPTSCLQRNAVS